MLCVFVVTYIVHLYELITDFYAAIINDYLQMHSNPAKSQLITFGGKTPHDNKMYMNGTAMPLVEKVQYLRTYSWCKSGMSDISSNIRKFYSQFNNIFSVLGKSTQEMATLYT